jgi:hypothetical protein
MNKNENKNKITKQKSDEDVHTILTATINLNQPICQI